MSKSIAPASSLSHTRRYRHKCRLEALESPFSADLVCIFSEFRADGKSVVIACGGDSQETEEFAVEGRQFGG